MTRQTTAPSTGSQAQLPVPERGVLESVQATIESWFAEHARDLPWRAPGTTPWGVLVSEVMSQQTPMSRVAPRWIEWMTAWPTPADLAEAPTSQVLLAWDTLGYPRRALRLQECARVIATDFDNRVPTTVAELESLPGIGTYTAAAVASFAYHLPATVLDVNIRRALSRIFTGVEHPRAALGKKEQSWAAELVPASGHVEWNAGLMELGALVCTSRNPACETCPVAAHCAWLAAGRPAAEPARKPKTQAWEGTDRQLRGAIMAALRAQAVQADVAAEVAPGSAVTPASATPGVAADLFTAQASEFDPDALEPYSPDVRAKVMRVRDLGDSARIARLAADLVSDGLLVRAGDSGELLALP